MATLDTRPAPTPSRRRVGLVIAIVTGLLLAGAAVTAYLLTRPDPTFTVTGTLAVKGSRGFGDACDLRAGYSDIRRGAAVTVTDAAGAVVGVGALDAGTQNDTVTCRFRFTVADVRKGAGFYSVQVSQRAPVRYAETDVVGKELTLSLG